MKLKTLLIIIQIFIASISSAQEFNLGGNIGFGLINSSSKPFLGCTIEYRMNKSLLSINSDPFILLVNKEVILTEPIYFKLILGKKVKICAEFGGFIRTNSNYGWLAGYGIEHDIKEKLVISLKGDYYSDYWTSDAPTHFGTTYLEKNKGGTFWISIGIKRRLK